MHERENAHMVGEDSVDDAEREVPELMAPIVTIEERPS